MSAIGALFTVVHHSYYQGIHPFQIPKELLRGDEVRSDLLEELGLLTGIHPFDGDSFAETLRSCVIIADQLVAAILYLLPFVLRNEDLFNACSFFRACCSEYSFMDGVIGDVLRDPKRGPIDEAERLGFENVILQSFRVAEAIAGEPGKEQRFRARLKEWGLDYDEKVGFPGRRPDKLGDRIRWLQEQRDSAAAHGRRRRRHPFTQFEAMEAQHIAESMLDRALWSTADLVGRNGDEAELTFLLKELLPRVRNHPGWVNDAKVFRGKSAVDLVRLPGGLARVRRSFRRRHIRAVSR